MKKILVLFTVMCVALVATAQKNMDGIVFGYKYHSNELYYKIHGKEVSVTSSVRSANYTKTLEIPREVRHKGKTYRVTGIEKYGISDATKKLLYPVLLKEWRRIHSKIALTFVKFIVKGEYNLFRVSVS